MAASIAVRSMHFIDIGVTFSLARIIGGAEGGRLVRQDLCALAGEVEPGHGDVSTG